MPRLDHPIHAAASNSHSLLGLQFEVEEGQQPTTTDITPEDQMPLWMLCPYCHS